MGQGLCSGGGAGGCAGWGWCARGEGRARGGGGTGRGAVGSASNLEWVSIRIHAAGDLRAGREAKYGERRAEFDAPCWCKGQVACDIGGLVNRLAC